MLAARWPLVLSVIFTCIGVSTSERKEFGLKILSTNPSSPGGSYLFIYSRHSFDSLKYSGLSLWIGPPPLVPSPTKSPGDFRLFVSLSVCRAHLCGRYGATISLLLLLFLIYEILELRALQAQGNALLPEPSVAVQVDNIFIGTVDESALGRNVIVRQPDLATMRNYSSLKDNLHKARWALLHYHKKSQGRGVSRLVL